ncbi:MAG TPA: ATP-binding protein [Bacteroidia bacterium]|jgi:signal transduction histidine kinase
MSIKFQLFTGFFILIFIFVIDFFVNQKLSNEVIRNTTYISNSETIIRNSNLLQKEMIEMQSGFRGFLLTGQKSFLQPYYHGLKSVPPRLEEERGLVSTTAQKNDLDTINKLHHQWIQYSKQLITTRLDTFPDASKLYQQLFETKLRTEVGKKLNDRIQNIFRGFDNLEYQIRQERRKALQQSLESTKIITLSLTVASVFLAIISSFYLIRVITKRISKMVNLAKAISKGEFRTIEDNKKDELNNLAISLNTMSLTLEKNFNELTKKNRELDQFAYVVSHDLKAPLRGIANIVSWVEEDHEQDTTPEIRHNLSLIKGRTNRLENMINGLLEYARVGKIKRGTEKIELEILVRELIDLLVPRNYNVVIGPMPTLFAEKLHLEQVFSNLISNAVKYNHRKDGKIIIRSEEFTDHYCFYVTDNGPGIDSKYFDKIFIIFQTLQERDAFESTGVGLAIVKKVIEDNKGTIRVESELGKGTSFIFTWPKADIKNQI